MCVSQKRLLIPIKKNIHYFSVIFLLCVSDTVLKVVMVHLHQYWYDWILCFMDDFERFKVRISFRAQTHTDEKNGYMIALFFQVTLGM